MKAFTWRLQRLLDIRQKQEDAVKSEVMALTEQIIAIRGRILMEKAMLRSRLAGLRQTAAEQRLDRQRMFMEYASVIDTQIASLHHELSGLEQKRREKTEAMMTVRKSRKALERLREQAFELYCRMRHSEEQKNEDETTNAAFARKVMSRDSQLLTAVL